MNLLVIEDESKVAQAIAASLRGLGWTVTTTSNGEEGFYLVSTQRFDAIILDLMLPGRDGLEILTSLRQREIATPVLILTAKDDIETRVRGLDGGADDYLIKPFAFAELHARLRALHRRAKLDLSAPIAYGDLLIDVGARTVARDGIPLALTLKEFDLLTYLARHAGVVVSRDMLARDVWQELARATPLDNVIDVHIARLRRKLDEPFQTKLIHTVRGIGFVLRRDLA